MLKDDNGIFWTDEEQARERLASSLVMYDNQPAYVVEIINAGNFDDNIPRVVLRFCAEPTKKVRKHLNSPKFEKFRKLPPLGFMITTDRRCFFTQRVAQRTRTHGISSRAVTCYSFDFQRGTPYVPSSGIASFDQLYFDKGFVDSCADAFPSLNKILLNIPNNATIPYSRKFAVYRDNLGIRWLYRELDRIGFFSGADTLNLLETTSFYREEIMEDPLFTINTIKEY